MRLGGSRFAKMLTLNHNNTPEMKIMFKIEYLSSKKSAFVIFDVS